MGSHNPLKTTREEQGFWTSSESTVGWKRSEVTRPAGHHGCGFTSSGAVARDASIRTWMMRFDGRDFRAESGPDDWYTWHVVIDPGHTPARLEFAIEDCRCAHKGMTSNGIFVWDGESIVVAAPRPRPAAPHSVSRGKRGDDAAGAGWSRKGSVRSGMLRSDTPEGWRSTMGTTNAAVGGKGLVVAIATATLGGPQAAPVGDTEGHRARRCTRDSAARGNPGRTEGHRQIDNRTPRALRSRLRVRHYIMTAADRAVSSSKTVTICLPRAGRIVDKA